MSKATETTALSSPALTAPAASRAATTTPALETSAQQVPVGTKALEWTATPLYQAGLLNLGSLGSTPVQTTAGPPQAIYVQGLTEVTFLQDGIEFFPTISDELKRVKAATAGYVHLAYWDAALGTPLTDPYDSSTPDEVLEDQLRDVAAAGHDVRVILWDPGSLSSLVSPQHQAAVNFRDILGSDPSGRITVRLEQYGTMPQSQHQKIAIFSADGEVHAVVGGLNMGNWYWDTSLHAGSRPVGNYHTIHDTAVSLRGAATADVEREFLRRWARAGEPPPPAAPTAPAVVSNGSYVDIKVTDVEHGRRDIRDTLVQAIAVAERYVYLENYAIFDSVLVNALASRLRQQPSLQVLLNIPHPDKKWFGPPNGYLHRLTWLTLALQVCDEVQVSIAEGIRLLTRATARAWNIYQPFGVGSKEHMDLDPWLEQSFLIYDDGVSRYAVPFSAITFVNGPFRMYTPVRATSGNAWQPIYIHSKLAVIDDETAAIGSANFNYRSMLYDGELTAFIVGAGDARDIRQRLFFEYGMPEPSGWKAAADANAAVFAAGQAVPGEMRILALDFQDFPSRVPDLSGSQAPDIAKQLPQGQEWLAQDLSAVVVAWTGYDSRTFH